MNHDSLIQSHTCMGIEFIWGAILSCLPQKFLSGFLAPSHKNEQMNKTYYLVWSAENKINGQNNGCQSKKLTIFVGRLNKQQAP